jgi:hypothetical protein
MNFCWSEMHRVDRFFIDTFRSSSRATVHSWVGYSPPIKKNSLIAARHQNSMLPGWRAVPGFSAMDSMDIRNRVCRTSVDEGLRVMGLDQSRIPGRLRACTGPWSDELSIPDVLLYD